MAASASIHVLRLNLSHFKEIFHSPEKFTEPQASKFNEVKRITKDLYDNAYLSSKSLNGFQTNSLPKLLIDGFDDEQIWQQIDLLNISAVTQFSKVISNLEVEKKPEPMYADFGTTDKGVNYSDDGKTEFELEQEKIKKKIQECEESMLQPLSWHLTGEVAASSRPIDSLVEKDTEFDCNAKQDLVVDNALTEKIESIIKMAIKNKAYNDVERKIKRIEEVIAYKKEIFLDQNKSKKGLAEVYEEEYLKKQTKEVEEENPKHEEVKKLMAELFPELQALFSHIPKPVVPEIKIVSNLPAVTVEEVAPTCVSDAAFLAPEEVRKRYLSTHRRRKKQKTIKTK